MSVTALIRTPNRKSSLHLSLLTIYNQCKETSQFKTQCKGDISHASKTAKITVFDPVICKTPELLRSFRAVSGQKWGSLIDFDSCPYNRSAQPCCLWSCRCGVLVLIIITGLLQLVVSLWLCMMLWFLISLVFCRLLATTYIWYKDVAYAFIFMVMFYAASFIAMSRTACHAANCNIFSLKFNFPRTNRQFFFGKKCNIAKCQLHCK